MDAYPSGLTLGAHMAHLEADPRFRKFSDSGVGWGAGFWVDFGGRELNNWSGKHEIGLELGHHGSILAEIQYGKSHKAQDACHSPLRPPNPPKD